MKNLLIVFIVLLFLLTLLSSFGGSIKVSEPFYDAKPAYKSKEPLGYDVPNPPRYATFNQPTDQQEHFNEYPQPEHFYEDSTQQPAAPVPPAFVPESTQMGSQPTALTASAAESFGNLEKFDIPEPFVNADIQTGAPF